MPAKKKFAVEGEELETTEEVNQPESKEYNSSTPPSDGQETVEQLLAKWEGQLLSDRDGYSHHIDNPNTLVGARYDVLQNHVKELKAALGK